VSTSRHVERPIHFQDVVEHLPLVPYIDRLDESSTAVYIGPQIEELTGYPWEAFARDQQLFLRLVHPDDRGLYLTLVERRNRENVPASGEYRLVRSDGRVVWVQDHERLLEDANGRPVAAQGYLIDVTERRSQRVRLEAINTVLAAFSAGVAGDELVRTGLEALADAVPGLRIAYVAVDAAGNLELVHSTGGTPLAPIAPGVVEADAVAEYLEPLRRGETVSSVDGSRADRFGEPFASLGEGEVAAFLDVPIRHAGRLVSILCTDSAVARAFEPEALQTLRELGRQLAVALERERAEADLRRRDEILTTVSRGAAIVLAGASWEDAAPGLLESLGAATEASRAYIFQLDGGDGPLRASQRFEWVAAGVSAEIDNPELRGLVFAERGLDELAAAVTRGEVLPMLVRELPATARRLLEAQSIRSLLVVPIVVEGTAWGFVGFDDCETERDWSPAETEALRTAASLIGAAIARERSEAAVREHETKVRAVFDASFDGIFLIDDERRYVDLNDTAAALLELPRDALVGRRMDDVFPPEHRFAVLERWREVSGASGEVVGEYALPQRDGSTRDVEYSARPSFLPGLSIVFVRDVTERRRLESRLQAAERLESMGRLAGGVAHDFNNLLTAISGYTGLALERAAHDPELAQDLGEIQRAADRAADLTRQLLAFGRRQVLDPRPLDLARVVTDVRPMVRGLLGDDVTLETRHEAATPTVLADPGQLEQVVVNLALNARDAMPGGGTLTIGTYATTRDDVPWAALEVTDTGVGMSAETRARAFEPFFTTRPDGVGLGLASVYGIVAQSQGTIEVTSEPGRGSTFTVLLPAGAPAAAAAPAVTPEAAPAEHGTETVLLVEDEEVVRALARRVLEQHGYRVLESRNGHEAIGIAETHDGEIHVLLTDVVMPGLRGHEVADRVAATRPGIQVVFMSGFADEALLGRAATGGSHFLEKPFSSAALAAKLREALASGRP
jgi:PAS domain S-box-containing protein